jgi:hypothetical protein
VNGGVVVSCVCGEVYELRPEYAGRLLECPRCGRHLRAGRAPGAPRLAGPTEDPAFDRDVFLLRQRAFSITSKYEVWTEDGRPLLYVERPTYPVRTVLAYALAVVAAWFVMVWTAQAAVAAGETAGPLLAIVGWALAAGTFLVVSMSARPLRHVTVFRDDSRREPLLRVFQDQRLAILQRTYTLATAGGEPLARLRKNYLHNVLRKRWYAQTPAGQPLALAIEDSVVLSLLRRVVGPLFGVLRTNFLFIAGGQLVGEFNRKFTLFDRYVLDLTADPERTLDRRVALALGVMLDTGERR